VMASTGGRSHNNFKPDQEELGTASTTKLPPVTIGFLWSQK